MINKRFWYIGSIGLLMALWLIAACQSNPKPELAGDKDMKEMIEMVLNSRPKASLLAKKIGPTANPELIKLAKHEDADVRLVAFYCLQETGGEDAAKVMVVALSDEDSQVRGAALNGLYKRPEPVVFPKLLEVLDSSDDTYVRQQIAFIIGLMEQPSAKVELKRRWLKLEDEEIAEGMITALARLGDLEAQAEFVKRLHLSQNETRVRYLEHCEYINQAWLLKNLLPILDDLGPMIRIGVDGADSVNEYLRTCDIAINLIGALSETKFSFEFSGGANYTVDEIEEARIYLKSLGEK